MSGGLKLSANLTEDENEQIIQLLGNKCESLATSVVQLFSTEPPDHDSWVKKDAGVLCLVKDNVQRSYFLRIYCASRQSLVWEHEVFTDMEYNQLSTFMHTFQGQEGIIAFNFTSEDEASFMHNALVQTLERKKMRPKRRSRPASNLAPLVPASNSLCSDLPSNQGVPLKCNPRPAYHTHQAHHQTKAAPALKSPLLSPGGKHKDQRKGKLRACDIGHPFDFRVISHVGLDTVKGFDVDVNDPQLKHFFVKAGVSAKQLKDRRTRQFINEFIAQNGGLAALQDDPPLRDDPPLKEDPSSRAPPEQCCSPGYTQQCTTAPEPPVLGDIRGSLSKDTPPRGSRNTPPPPPPMMPPPPPPPPPPASVTKPVNGSSALKPATGGKPSGADSRGELLDQIRGGKQLKPVRILERDEVVVNEKTFPTGSKADALADALHRALAQRKLATHSDADTEQEDTDGGWADFD